MGKSIWNRVIEWIYVGSLFVVPAVPVIWAQQWGLLIVYAVAGIAFVIVEAWLHFATGKTITKRMRALLQEGFWGYVKVGLVAIGLIYFAVALGGHFFFRWPV